MKNLILEEKRKVKNRRKVFTKKKVSNTIRNKNCTPLKVNCKIYKRRDGSYMEEKELKETIFIDEESYQQIKKKMCKKDDYFTEKELQNLA